MAKEYMENMTDYVRVEGTVKLGIKQEVRSNSRNWGRPVQGTNKVDRIEETTKKMLEGHKVKGKEYCIAYQMKDEKGDPKCRDRRCSRAHFCGFVDKFTRKPCGKSHPKFEHRM